MMVLFIKSLLYETIYLELNIIAKTRNASEIERLF